MILQIILNSTVWTFECRVNTLSVTFFSPSGHIFQTLNLQLQESQSRAPLISVSDGCVLFKPLWWRIWFDLCMIYDGWRPQYLHLATTHKTLPWWLIMSLNGNTACEPVRYMTKGVINISSHNGSADKKDLLVWLYLQCWWWEMNAETWHNLNISIIEHDYRLTV